MPTLPRGQEHVAHARPLTLGKPAGALGNHPARDAARETAELGKPRQPAARECPPGAGKPSSLTASPATTAGNALEGSGKLGGNPAAVKIPGLRHDSLPIDGAAIERTCVEGHMIAEHREGR